MTRWISFPFYRNEPLRNQHTQRFVVLDVRLNNAIADDFLCFSDEPAGMTLTPLSIDSGYQKEKSLL
jgi:hypothetical protein